VSIKRDKFLKCIVFEMFSSSYLNFHRDKLKKLHLESTFNKPKNQENSQ